VLGWLTDPFQDAFMRRALAEVLVLGLACGPLGAWILLYRQSYAAESISHGMLPGLVLAALAGAPLVLGAAGGVLVAAAAIALAGRDERIGGDAGVAVAVSTLFGLGAVLALSPAAPPRLQELLFGDLLGASATDVTVAALLALVVAVALRLGHRRLAVSAFDPAAAPSLGVRPARWELALLVVLALATVAAAPGLGSLLLVALIVAPGAAALQLAARLPAVLALAAAAAALAGLAGLVLSYHLGIAAGASVALCAVLLAAIGGGVRGVSRRYPS
jgi:ABC-type Mn2+/Zn2+ transport system permease subunit